MQTFIQNLRYGLRMLTKSPAFTTVAILSLALGIGANTAIFTLINDLLLKSLPVHDPQALVAFGQEFGGGIIAYPADYRGAVDLFPYDFYKQIENQRAAFEGITAYTSFNPSLSVKHEETSNGTPTQATGHLVSGNFFTVLGAHTILGRPIAPSDADAPGGHAVAVLSYRYWQKEFSGDPAIIGKAMTVNGTPFIVIGVADPKFYGVELDQDPPDMWLPLTMQAEVMLQPSLLGPHGLSFLHFMGRRKSGESMEQVQEWVNLQFRNYLTANEGSHLTAARSQVIQKVFVQLMPGSTGISNLRVQYAEPLRILMGLVALVLLIACANLANFLLAKTASREREISTRLALGASRPAIVFQMLTEALLLSFLGGAVGLLLAFWGTRLLINFVAAGATDTPFSPNPDIHVLAFTLCVSLFTGILFGLAPALRVSRVSVTPGLGSTSRSVAGGETRTTRLLPKFLVASQMGLALVLLLAAGLLVRTLRNLEHQDFGFNRENQLMVNFDAKTVGYKPEQLPGLYQRILDRMQALPGVRSATLAGTPPMSPGSWDAPISIKGYAAQPNEDMNTLINGVGPRYFETVGMPLLEGRSIGPQDVSQSPQAVVINETLANHFFPHGNAIGQLLTMGDPSVKGEWEIVGVARTAKYNSLRETPQRMIYLPVMQLPGNDAYASWLLLRTEGDPEKVTEEVRRALVEIDPNLPIIKIETISQQLETFTGTETLISQLSIFFSLLALLLACIGLYGVMTYNVLRRTNEIGVRMALGAQSRGVLWMVMKESLALLGIGIALGVPAALAATRLLQSQLFGIKSSDPLTVFAAVFIVAVTTMLAGYFPARRATRIDPMTALRYE
jgi:predicted permease